METTVRRGAWWWCLKKNTKSDCKFPQCLLILVCNCTMIVEIWLAGTWEQNKNKYFYFILFVFFFWNLKDAETQFVSPWWDSGPWPLKLSEFSYCWLLTTFKINILWASLASLIPYCFINKTTFLTKINVLIIVWTPSLWTGRINT